MMSRGGSRGFIPRGGSTYRGRGGDSSWNGERSRGRGGFSGPSRGRFNYFKENSSGFDSRKYSGGSSGERYSTRGRGGGSGGEDLGYRRSYHRPDPSYSSRERSHHRSPEPPHKRIRSESYGAQASSSRRSHEGGYSGSGGDYSNRYSGYPEEKGGSYGEPRGRFREERRSSSYRDRSREDYPHRKSELMMPPPSATRHLTSSRSRGTYRGRISIRGSRGITRVLQARRIDSMVIRKRFSDSYALRTHTTLATKLQADAWRKLKIQKLRSRLALKRAAEAEGKEGDEEDSEEGEDDADIVKAEEELEEGETVDKESPPKKVKKIKVEEDREEGEEVDEEEEEGGAKEEGNVEGGVHITIKHDSDARAVSDDVHSRHAVPSYRKHFIRLCCPHCAFRCQTFKDYLVHLYSPRHVSAMRKQSLMHKQRLVSMRVSQRQEQRLLEEAEEIEGGVLSAHTNFCHICKLNFRQLKTKHFMSETHLAMKKFLMPFCRVCRVSFKSPMLYENHICSLDHIKRKAHHDALTQGDENASGSEGDSDEKDLDKYMTLDSVGEVDAEDEDVDEDIEGSKEPQAEGAAKEKAKEDVNPGSEYLRKVEVYFCDLCKLYLPRLDQADRAISMHCNSRNHLQRYVHFRRDRALRKRAETIHHKESAEKKAEAQKLTEAKKTGPTPNGSDEVPKKVVAVPATGAEQEPATKTVAPKVSAEPAVMLTPDTSVEDSKMWADVNKDLVDLLDEVVPVSKGSSDDEDETEGRRYDKFRYSSRKSVTAETTPDAGAAQTLATEEGGATVKQEASEQIEPAVAENKNVEKKVDAASTGELPTETAEV